MKIQSLKSINLIIFSLIINSLSVKWELSIMNVNFVKITIIKFNEKNHFVQSIIWSNQNNRTC